MERNTSDILIRPMLPLQHHTEVMARVMAQANAVVSVEEINQEEAN